jgi:hypothetical protein
MKTFEQCYGFSVYENELVLKQGFTQIAKDFSHRNKVFDSQNLQGADFSGVNLRGFSFRNADLRGANFEGSILEDVDFSGAKIQTANFFGCHISDSSFQDCDGSSADFRDALLERVDFSMTVLDEADFQYSEIIDCDFSDAEMHGCLLPNNFNIQKLLLENDQITCGNCESRRPTHCSSCGFEGQSDSGGPMDALWNEFSSDRNVRDLDYEIFEHENPDDEDWINDLDDDDEGTHLFQPCLEDLKGAAYRAYLDSEDAVFSSKS